MEIFEKELKLFEEKLSESLPPTTECPPKIFEAMRYSVEGGGKRFRPILTMTVCEACGGDIEASLLPAVAIELVHCYSLVHDDLPSMDDDDMRRGKPSCHKKFGENVAILTGDALLNLAFEVIARIKPSEQAINILRELSTSSGTHGMIGGQVADILIPKDERDVPAIDYISIHKTGHLIKAAVCMGAITANVDSSTLKKMTQYGECIGLAFQVVDDILDGDGYLEHMEQKEALAMARDLVAVAKKSTKHLGEKAKKLHYLADFIIGRVEHVEHV